MIRVFPSKTSTLPIATTTFPSSCWSSALISTLRPAPPSGRALITTLGGANVHPILLKDFLSSSAPAPLSTFLSRGANCCAREETQIALTTRAGRRADERIRGKRVKWYLG